MGNQGWTLVLMAALVALNLFGQRSYITGVRAGVEKSVDSGSKSGWMMRLNPNYLTATGVMLCLVAAGLTYYRHNGTGWGWLIVAIFIVGSLLDVFDGTVARKTGRKSDTGKFFDSNTDRMGEGAMLLVFIVLAAQQGNIAAVTAAAVALWGGGQVPYAMATAELLLPRELLPVGGLAGRAERCTAITFMVAWLCWGWAWTYWLYLLAILTWVTTFWRWYIVKRNLRLKEPS